MGEIRAKTEKAKGATAGSGPGRGKAGARAGRAFAGAPTNVELGISKKLSARAQKLAAVPAEIFEAKDDSKELGFTAFADRMTR